jgi:hypothetical protein
MACPHNIDNTCEIASSIAEIAVPIDESTCLACTNCPRSRRLNAHTITLALVYKPDLDPVYLRSVVDGHSHGFGTRLSNTLSIFFQESEGCACKGHKDILDVWTPSYIRKNMEGVINWLQSEAKNRNLPFFRPAARILLNTLLLYEESR